MAKRRFTAGVGYASLRAAVVGRSVCLAAVLLLVACGPTPSRVDPSPIDVTQDPVQDPLDSPDPIQLNRSGTEFTLTPKARYVLCGIVVSESTYRYDAMHDLAPCDVAICWGSLVKGKLYRQIKWSQSNRWYWWRYDDGFGHDNDWVSRWSSNTHIIPADRNLSMAARGLKEGQPAELEGDLVYVDWKTGGQKRWWRTSLSRQDKGNGSCEILYLTRVKQGGKVYE